VKISALRIENFRSYSDETIVISRYTCLVGPNGSGKSTIIAALDLFFHGPASMPDGKIGREDFFNRQTSDPIRITVTFDDLTAAEAAGLSAYVRQGTLIVTAESTYNSSDNSAPVRVYGRRLGIEAFRRYFDADKRGAPAAELRAIYAEIRAGFGELADLRVKAQMEETLISYEASAAGAPQCVEIPSEDHFYGIGGTGRLGEFLGWVVVPAVRDASAESVASRNSSLGTLISLATGRADLLAEIEQLRLESIENYTKVVERGNLMLEDLGRSLHRRLTEWTHPDVTLELYWQVDHNRPVTMQEPVAAVKAGEGGFSSTIGRMGHGFQRSYLVALLQEVADARDRVRNAQEPAPTRSPRTLILAIEEPELYQHPPQAWYLAEVLRNLGSAGTGQVIVATHSPVFVSGSDFDGLRLVSRSPGGSHVRWATPDNIRHRIVQAGARGGPNELATLARIHESLQPGTAEMFFARVPVIVEGIEDVAYLTTYMHKLGLWSDFRRLGCHFVQAHGKSSITRVLAIALEFGLCPYVVFDADTNCQPAHRPANEHDNRVLMSMLGMTCDPMPTDDVHTDRATIWATNITLVVRTDLGPHYDTHVEPARREYGHDADLEKKALFIAAWLGAAFDAGHRSERLATVCEGIVEYAGGARASRP